MTSPIECDEYPLVSSSLSFRPKIFFTRERRDACTLGGVSKERTTGIFCKMKNKHLKSVNARGSKNDNGTRSMSLDNPTDAPLL